MNINEQAALAEIMKRMAQDPLSSLTFGLRIGYETESTFRDMYKNMLEHIDSLPDLTKNDIRDEYIAIFIFYLSEVYFRLLKKQPTQLRQIIDTLLEVYYSNNEIRTNKRGLENFIKFILERATVYHKGVPGSATFENLEKAYHRLNEHIIKTRLDKIFNGLKDSEIQEWKFYLQAHLDGFPRYILTFFSINPLP